MINLNTLVQGFEPRNHLDYKNSTLLVVKSKRSCCFTNYSRATLRREQFAVKQAISELKNLPLSDLADHQKFLRLYHLVDRRLKTVQKRTRGCFGRIKSTFFRSRKHNQEIRQLEKSLVQLKRSMQASQNLANSILTIASSNRHLPEKEQCARLRKVYPEVFVQGKISSKDFKLTENSKATKVPFFITQKKNRKYELTLPAVLNKAPEKIVMTSLSNLPRIYHSHCIKRAFESCKQLSAPLETIVCAHKTAKSYESVHLTLLGNKATATFLNPLTDAIEYKVFDLEQPKTRNSLKADIEKLIEKNTHHYHNLKTLFDLDSDLKRYLASYYLSPKDLVSPNVTPLKRAGSLSFDFSQKFTDSLEIHFWSLTTGFDKTNKISLQVDHPVFKIVSKIEKILEKNIQLYFKKKEETPEYVKIDWSAKPLAYHAYIDLEGTSFSFEENYLRKGSLEKIKLKIKELEENYKRIKDIKNKEVIKQQDYDIEISRASEDSNLKFNIKLVDKTGFCLLQETFSVIESISKKVECYQKRTKEILDNQRFIEKYRKDEASPAIVIGKEKRRIHITKANQEQYSVEIYNKNDPEGTPPIKSIFIPIIDPIEESFCTHPRVSEEEMVDIFGLKFKSTSINTLERNLGLI